MPAENGDKSYPDSIEPIRTRKRTAQVGEKVCSYIDAGDMAMILKRDAK
jgi:hypothetical protein